MVRDLTKFDITVLKSFKAPPEKIINLLVIVKKLLGQGSDYENNWVGAQKMLLDAKFMEKLIGFDKDEENKVPAKLKTEVQAYLDNKAIN